MTLFVETPLYIQTWEVPYLHLEPSFLLYRNLTLLKPIYSVLPIVTISERDRYARGPQTNPNSTLIAYPRRKQETKKEGGGGGI